MLGGLGHGPTHAEQANALVDGFQVAFTWAAILVAVGAALLAVVLRPRDVAALDAEAALAPGG